MSLQQTDQQKSRRFPPAMLLASGVFALGLTFAIDSAFGHPTYSGCSSCHGNFEGGVSPQGTIFPGNDKHQMHRSSNSMDTECFLCHTEIGDNPMIGSSAGTANNPGIGCTGCHEATGLRRHHVVNGITACLECHPSDPEPPAESVSPVYYGTVDTNVSDPCNSGPMFGENWSIGDTTGLDNDGDNLYDGDDPDCSDTCLGDTNGDSMVDVQDLVNVILDWGCTDPPGPCPGDLTGDGTTDVQDLVGVILAWGMCP